MLIKWPFSGVSASRFAAPERGECENNKGEPFGMRRGEKGLNFLPPLMSFVAAAAFDRSLGSSKWSTTGDRGTSSILEDCIANGPAGRWLAALGSGQHSPGQIMGRRASAGAPLIRFEPDGEARARELAKLSRSLPTTTTRLSINHGG